ncbi:hypothetical protein MMC24_000853 [Lignoscripta atroalba]|nr:hypothetical protein [Lignoscripta atroalba]
MAAIGTSAQSTSSTSAPVSVVTQYSYTDDCSTLTAPEYASTVTGTVIVTYCPECTDKPMSYSSSYTSKGIFTTYTTVYSSFCPTGLAPVTYTVTESCSSTGQTRDSTYVPQGYTTTVETCNVCQYPTVATLTVPMPAYTAATTPAGIAPQISSALVGVGISSDSGVATPAGGPAGPASAATGAPGSPGGSSPPSSGSSPGSPAAPAPAQVGCAYPGCPSPVPAAAAPAGASPGSPSGVGTAPAGSAIVPETPATAPSPGVGSSPGKYDASPAAGSGSGSSPGYGSNSTTSSAPIVPYTGGASSTSLCMSLVTVALGLAFGVVYNH